MTSDLTHTDADADAGVSAAQLWNGLTGGKDYRRAERDLINAISALTTGMPALAVASDRFRLAACGYIAEQYGIDQWLDCGVGLPAGTAPHDVIHGHIPEAAVYYVDHDPAVLAHAHALLAGDPGVHVVAGDIFDPAAVIAATTAAGLDWSRPVAVLHTATLHHHPGPVGDIAELVSAYTAAAAPGSCTVISHFLDPSRLPLSDLARQVQNTLTASTLGTGWFRTATEIEALFGTGQNLIAPSIMPCAVWPALVPGQADNTLATCIAGGIARKPLPRRADATP